MSRTMLIHKQLYQQFNLHCIISSDTGTGALAEMGEGALDWCTIRDWGWCTGLVHHQRLGMAHWTGAPSEIGEGALDWCTIQRLGMAHWTGAPSEIGEGALDWCTIRDWEWRTGLVHHQR